MEHKSEANSSLSLELRCILREILKNIWIVLALAVSAACLSFVASKLLYSPTYTSSTTFMVSRSGGSNTAAGNLQKAIDTAPVFQTLVSSDLMQKRIAADMGLDTIPGTIAVSAVPETNLMTISATAGRPDTAFLMIKSLMRVYPEVSDKSIGKVILDVFDPPKFADYPDASFSGGRVMGLAFLITALASAAVLGGMSYYRDTVKSPAQAKSKLDTQVFTVVYHERQYKKLKDFIKGKRKPMRMTDPSVSFLYEETMKKIATKLLYKLHGDDAKVVLVTSTLPGEGKSTLCMNIAQDLSHRGKRVLLIEGDIQNPGLAQVLHLRQKNLPSWGDYLYHNQDPSEAMVQLKYYGFAALLNSKALPPSTDWLAVSHLPQWIEAWKEQFDIILVDAPPVRHRSDTELWARCADLSLLVVRRNMAEAKYINDSVDMLEGYGSGLLGCIFNDAIKARDFSSSGYGYGYGSYGSYGHYGHYGHYGRYGSYNKYGSYGKYGKSKQSDGPDTSELDED